MCRDYGVCPSSDLSSWSTVGSRRILVFESYVSPSLDAVSATAIYSDDVFDAFHGDVWPQYCPKETQFRRAEAFARCGGRTDRTVILNQEKSAISFGLHFSHVAFLGPDASQPVNLFLQRKGGWDSLRVFCFLPGAPGIEHLLQSSVAKCVPEGIDKRHAQFSIGVGK